MPELYLVINCPHCQGCMIIHKNEINCRIFRHGVMIKTQKQINPHEKKHICDMLKKNDLIYGCGKPFRLNNDNIPEICEYI
jgi:hypothetical protein